MTNTTVESEYQDGFILSEVEQGDKSLFSDGHNTFYDIINRLCESEHGPMLRFSVFWDGKRHDIDWIEVPPNARPIRFRHRQVQWNGGGDTLSDEWLGVDFGYQYTDSYGKNVQEVEKFS